MAKIHVLASKISKTVKMYGTHLLRHHIPCDRLIVFGSQASGRAKPWSDIDVCVVSKKFGKNRHDERIALMKLLTDATGDIEPHPYHPKDLENRWDPLAAEIRKYGITV